jgi:hypothetical protein
VDRVLLQATKNRKEKRIGKKHEDKEQIQGNEKTTKRKSTKYREKTNKKEYIGRMTVVRRKANHVLAGN